MRQMPHGQWVPFEADDPHDCDKRPAASAAPPARPTSPRPAEPAVPFTPLYPKVTEPPAPSPSAGCSQAPPNPPPRGSSVPSPIVPEPTLRPTSVSRPAKPPNSLRLAPVVPTTIPAPQPTPPYKPSKLGVFLAWITALAGTTVGLSFAILRFLALPLSLVATMHLTGWSWFGAIIAALFFSCIPLIGQLGYLVLAIMGTYYLWMTNFNWQEAAYPPAQTFSVATLSDGELERFKGDVVRQGFEKACKSDALKTNGFNGKLPVRLASQCECFATNFAANLSRDDLIAFEKSGAYPDEVQVRLGAELRRACPG